LLFSFSALKIFPFTAAAGPLVVPLRKYMPSVIPLQTLATPGLRQVLLVFRHVSNPPYSSTFFHHPHQQIL
jgi:hypothetical protein